MNAGSVPVRLIGIDAPESRVDARAARQGAALGLDAPTIARMGRAAHDAAFPLDLRGGNVAG